MPRRARPKPLERLRQRSYVPLDRFIHHRVTDFTIMALIVLSVALLLVEAYRLVPPGVMEAVNLAGNLITLAFVVELSIRWFLSPSTRRFLDEYWIDCLAVVPFMRPLRFLRVLRLLRLYRLGSISRRYVRRIDFEGFYELLVEDYGSYRGDVDRAALLTPECFRALCNLLDDLRLGPEHRRLVNAALAYYVTPFEVRSRTVYGAEGAADEVYLSLWVMNELTKSLPGEIVGEAWEGEGEIIDIIAEELPRLAADLSEHAQRILMYVGLTNDRTASAGRGLQSSA